MSYWNVSILALLLIVIALQVIIARGNARMVAAELVLLDQKLAQAIQTVVEELPGSLGGSIDDQTTPFQGFLMDIIKERMKPAAIQVKEVPRDPSGKFADSLPSEN